MGSIYKALMGKEDCDIQDDELYPSTFSRLTSTGSTVNITSFPDIWKTHQGTINAKYYGDHTAIGATLNAAVGQTVNHTCKAIYIDAGAWTIEADYDWSSYTDVYWVFAPGAYLNVPLAYTVTFPDPSHIIASPTQQIFSGSGTVSFNTPGAVYVDWFLTNTTPGTTDMYAAYLAAYTSLPSAGGTILFVPEATYVIDTELSASKSNITIDGQNALVKSTTSGFLVNFDGDSGTDGDWSSAVRNCFVRNFRIGDANDANNLKKGVKFQWAINCGVENIDKRGFSSTSFQMSYTRQCYFRNIWNYGAQTASAAIGFLIHMSDDPFVENCHIRDGSFTYGIQLKGGENHKVHGFTAKNIKDAGSVTVDQVIRIRGDSPYEASATTGTYPYSTLAWTGADARRETIRPRLIDCSVEDCDGIGLLAQEARDVVMDGCSVNEAEMGIQIRKSSVGNTDKNFLIKNCLVEGSDNAEGIYLYGNSTYSLYGVIIEGCVIKDSYEQGINADYCYKPIIRDCQVKNNGQDAGSNYAGIAVAHTEYPLIVGCHCYDDQTGSETQDYGINIASTCTFPTIKDCTATGNVLGEIYCEIYANLVNNTPNFTNTTMLNMGNKDTSGTGEDDLRSVVVPADVWDIYGGCHIMAAGQNVNGNGNKTIKFYIGSTGITVHAADNNENDWRLEIHVANRGANNDQGITWAFWSGNTSYQGYDTAAEDTSANMTIKLTGECADASDIIRQKVWIVESLN